MDERITLVEIGAGDVGVAGLDATGMVLMASALLTMETNLREMISVHGTNRQIAQVT
jgi:hypothetical protein